MRDGLAWPFGLLVAGAVFLAASVVAHSSHVPRLSWGGDRVAAREAARPGIGVSVVKDGRRRSLVPDRTSATMDRIDVRVGAVVPIDVLLWEPGGDELAGVSLEPVAGGGCTFRMVRQGAEIGRGSMTAPPGSREHCLVPAMARDASLHATVRVGERPGMYTVMLSLHDGHYVRMLLLASA